MESVKTTGVQQPLIVRPEVSTAGEYEIVDGSGRFNALNPDEKVLVDIREDMSDVEVFRISEATSKRTQRNAYENAVFYTAYVDAVKKETGEKAARTRVSKEALISESELSQYLAINELFVTLNLLEPKSTFARTKLMGINKLYELSNLVKHPDLLEIAHEIEEKADRLTVEGIQEIVQNARSKLAGEPLEAAITDDVEEGGISDRENEATRTEARLKSLSEKVSGLMKELNSVLPEVRIEKLPRPALMSSETLNILEKMSVSLRRLLFYVKELRRM